MFLSFPFPVVGDRRIQKRKKWPFSKTKTNKLLVIEHTARLIMFIGSTMGILSNGLLDMRLDFIYYASISKRVYHLLMCPTFLCNNLTICRLRSSFLSDYLRLAWCAPTLGASYILHFRKGICLCFDYCNTFNRFQFFQKSFLRFKVFRTPFTECFIR